MRTLSLLLAAAICVAAGKGSTASGAVTPPDQIKVPPGFKVELLHEAGPREGSWICMAQDDKGRLYISPQNAIPESGFAKDSKWGGMWRVTLAEPESSRDKLQSTKNTSTARPGEILNLKSQILNWEKVPVPVGDAMGMLWAFDSLYVSGQGPQGRGIYRCKSSKGDDQLDTATLFKAIPNGNGEHGAHAIVLGPDKKHLYVMNGNSTPILDGLAPDSPYRNWGEDDLLPRLKDPVATFFDKIKAPYGCVYRTDENGTQWELFAGGLRNPYDLAFNPDGELFTYDADMEWDRGLPWYRPTRILHIVPGGEYGFREGSAKWPAWYPDSLPAVCDIGLGCPTGIAFYPGSLDVGTDAKGWPEKYRRALFLHDWTFGRILAVQLHEKGASYTARNDLASTTYPRDAEANHDVEVFLSGKGMPVTDMEFLKDGSMVFTVGGRGTAAALYRVSYVGKNAAKSETASDANGGASGSARASRAVPGAPPGTSDVANSRQPDTSAANERLSTPAASGGAPDAARGARALPIRSRGTDASRESDANPAPEAQRKSAGGAASEASATTGSPPAKASAPDGAEENALARAYRRYLEGERNAISDVVGLLRMTVQVRAIEAGDRFTYFAAGRVAEQLTQDNLRALALEDPSFTSGASGGGLLAAKNFSGLLAPISNLDTRVEVKNSQRAAALDGLMGLFAFARAGDASTQIDLLNTLGKYPLASLDGELKRIKLRVLELSFARQGRPSAEVVKMAVEKLSRHFPAKDPEAAKLNRELSQLLIWLTNPELGEMNSELAAKANNVGQISNLPGAGAANETKANGKSQPPTTETATPRQIGNLPYIGAARGLGPVPNPGASIFPGRQGDAALAAAGRAVIEKTLALMDAAPSQEEQIQYALALRWAHGWSPEQRVRYFRWFHEKAARYTGGNSFAKFVEAIRADAESRVAESERAALSQWLRPVAAPTPAAALKPRALVKAWTLPDIEAALDKLKDRQPDLARGRDLYTQAQCAQCHLFRDAGGNVGPDLTAVAQRFGRHDILESITDPSKVVSDQYAMVTLTILDGQGGTKEVSGLIKEETSATITLLTDPLTGKTSNLYKNVVTKREKAAVSTMPPGLLYTLTAEEVADLLALFGAASK